MENPAVSVIILTYNREADVLECLESVSRINYPNFETVVLDNGSTDSTVTSVRKKFPGVRIIENGKNLGFAEGNNVGICETTSPCVLVLNDDTIVGENLLKDLVEALQADPQAGLAGPKVLYYEARDRIWCAGARISPFGYAAHLGKGQTKEHCNSARAVDYVCGCAILIRREVFNKIGLLNSEYFTYFEDADYCFRARKAGYRCLYVPSPTVWHKAKSEWITSPAQAYYYMKNAFIFAKKNLQGLKKASFMASQVVFMFPYHSVRLIGKDARIFKNLARGLRDGLAYREKVT
jgi:GT2 family glycosyltransferase